MKHGIYELSHLFNSKSSLLAGQNLKTFRVTRDHVATICSHLATVVPHFVPELSELCARPSDGVQLCTSQWHLVPKGNEQIV